jgi:hypothetical protein
VSRNYKQINDKNHRMNDNVLTSNLANYTEIYKEFSFINENLNNESDKLNDILVNKTIENNDEINRIDLIIQRRENELIKFKKL